MDGTREPPRYLPLLLGDCVRMGLREAVHVARVVLEDRIEDQLPHLHVPTLVVRGERDPVVPQRWANVAARLLPAGRLAVIRGVAHVAHYAAPDQFVALACPFHTAAPDHGAREGARAGDDGDAGSV
jgi:pimeloyl-ACP methyl ester carboxylesterase